MSLLNFPGYLLEGRIGGKSSSALVFAAKKEEEDVVIKYIIPTKDTIQPVGIEFPLVREVGALKAICHPNVVKLIDVQPNYIVLERMHQTLKEYQKGKPLNTTTIRTFTYQLLLGLEACHQKGIMHRDLKPHNLLLNKDASCLKIADFGLARRTHRLDAQLYTPRQGTRSYKSPEMLLNLTKGYDLKTDIWSVGMIVVEMISGKPLFTVEGVDSCEADENTQTDLNALHTLFEWCGMPSKKTLMESKIWGRCKFQLKEKKNLASLSCMKDHPKELLYLLENMLQVESSKRLSCSELLLHSFFSNT